MPERKVKVELQLPNLCLFITSLVASAKISSVYHLRVLDVAFLCSVGMGTVYGASLASRAENLARQGRTKDAYLMAFGASLSSAVGRITLATEAGYVVMGARGALAGGISGTTAGAVDFIQNYRLVTRIVRERRSAIPGQFLS